MHGVKSIGVFDSGFGGLDILRGIVGKMPQYDYLYLGDTANAPYGPRSTSDVAQFARRAVDYLSAQDCPLIVFACNTASSDALHDIQHSYVPKQHPGQKVLGVLIPLSEEAARATRSGVIGVIATEGTVRSGAFIRELHKVNPSLEVRQQACPLLVPLIEAGEHESPAARDALRSYLAPLLAQHIDTLVLGCTHYGLLEREIREMVGPDITIVSGAATVADKLAAYLSRHPEIASQLSTKRTRRFCTTGEARPFEHLGRTFFGERFFAEHVELGPVVESPL